MTYSAERNQPVTARPMAPALLKLILTFYKRCAKHHLGLCADKGREILNRVCFA